MRPFKQSFIGEIVDLDNSETYNHLPNTLEELRNMMFSEIGKYYCYINYYRKEIKDLYEEQIIRVEKLINTFTSDEKYHYNDILWYKEQIFIFQDETENMC